ncbi:hypothetical protein BC830DRAFT_467493 [Chytriomyces sp. MP71]|nr:hypothetical protein BC830DRAFT_467493 [Chytriomyces sp. MP71]
MLLSALKTAIIPPTTSTAALPNILNKGNLHVELDSSSVTFNASLFASRFMPLPPTYSFPYKTGASLSYQNTSIINFLVDPVSLTSDRSSLNVNATLKIAFVNTDEAASALGAAVNPILAAKAQDSSFQITNIDVFKDTTRTSQFAWIQTLFGPNTWPFVFKVPAGTVDLAALFASSRPSTFTSLPINLQSFNVVQLQESQGFEANGNLTFSLPVSLPPVSINLGFGSIDVSLDGVYNAFVVTTANIELWPGKNTFNPIFSIKFSDDSSLQVSISNLINTALSERPISPNIVLSQLMFGASAIDQNLLLSGFQYDVTSKIAGFVIPIDINHLVSGFMAIPLPATIDVILNNFQSLGSPTMEPIQLSLHAGKNVNIQTSVSLQLPFPVSINVGYIRLATQVSGNTLLNVQTKLVSQDGQEGRTLFAINANMNFQDDTKTQVAVGSLTGTSVGLTSFSFGRSENDAVETFNQASFSIPVDSIVSPNGPIDVAKLLFSSSAGSASSFKVQMQSADFSMTTGKLLNVATTLLLSFPFVSRLSMPIFRTQISLGNTPMVTIQINGLNLDCGNRRWISRFRLYCRQNCNIGQRLFYIAICSRNNNSVRHCVWHVPKQCHPIVCTIASSDLFGVACITVEWVIQRFWVVPEFEQIGLQPGCCWNELPA